MRYSIVIVTILLLPLNDLSGQHGTAENGYYPPTYSGTTFVGNLTHADDDTREIILTYTNPGTAKTETFVGALEEGYTFRGKDGAPHELKPSNIKPGARIKVYYVAKTKKVAGKKAAVNSIFLVGGIPNIRGGYAQFKAFSGNN